MALFTVQPGTFWLHDRASLMASATAFERDSRTVKQVTIPVHGANPQRRLQAPPSCTALPSALWSAFSRPPALGVACSNAGHARPAYSRASAGPAIQCPAATRRRYCHCGAYGVLSAVTVPDGSTMTRIVVASPL